MNLGNNIRTVSRLGSVLKFLKLLEAALTVGIIGFTVLRIISIFREYN